MTDLSLSSLKDCQRLLMEVELKPRQGSRFQPTGFPDLGAALYDRPDGKRMLLVESPQSMANRLEDVCWDKGSNDLIPSLNGLSYIKILGNNRKFLSSSILEAHRINSPYILKENNKTIENLLKKELQLNETDPPDLQAFAAFVYKFDPNSLIHGVFISQKELAGGRLRLPRILSAFIEAENVVVVQSGGVKLDRIDPSGSAKEGFGNVPFSREEYCAERIVAYFNLDLAQIRGFRLPEPASELLFTLSIYKIKRFLKEGLRLRTACDLEATNGIKCNNDNFKLEEINMNELEERMQELIKKSREKGLFANPPVTEVVYVPQKSKTKKSEEGGTEDRENE